MDNNIVILNDDAGNEVKFEFLDLINYRNNEYAVLLPVSDDSEEVVILQIEETDDDTESYIGVDDDLTLNVVFELFKEKSKDLFDFT